MKNRNLLIAAVVLVVVATAFFIYRSRSAADAVPTYKTETVARATIAQTILSTGTVKPVTRVNIKPSIAGRAEKVFVKEGDHVRRNQILVLTSTTERAALLDAARARSLEAEKEYEQLYRPVPILAPIDGTIILRAIEPGQSFAVTDAILAMSDRLSVEALVDETDIAQIKDGQEATIILDAYPDTKIIGHVDKIAYEAVTTNNVTTYHVVVVPDKEPDFLRSGMTANVTFEITRKDDVLSVPTEALKRKKGQTLVLVPAESGDPKDPPRELPIEAGISDGKKTEVKSGLAEGQMVLIARTKTSVDSAGTNPFMPNRMGGGKK